MKKGAVILLSIILLCVSCGKIVNIFKSKKKLDASIATVEGNLGYAYNEYLSNLTVQKDVDKGILSIEIDLSTTSQGLLGMPYSLLVRLFDKNGNYLTHFTTEWTMLLAKQNGGKPHLSLEYDVSVRDLRDAEMAEVGYMLQ